MKSEIILWMSFLLPEMLSETENMMIRRQNDREIQNFYEPYHDKGDIVFLRNTWGPKGGLGKGAGEAEFYKKAKMEEYRGCNLVCPDLFKKSGEVCGWMWEKYLGYEWVRDEFQQFLPRGNYANFTYSNFNSICDLLIANCRDYLVPGTTVKPKPQGQNGKQATQYARPVWRLAHLGRCFEIDTNYQKNVFMSTWPDPAKGNKTYWEQRTDELLKNMDFAKFETYKPANVKSSQTLPPLFDPNAKG